MSIFASLLALFQADGTEAAAQDLTVGQRWSYDSGAAASSLVIGRIETINDEEVVSISVFRPDAEPVERDGEAFPMTEFGHLPFAAEAVRQSVGSLVETDASPSEMFEEGYREWREAVRDGGAGWFDVPVVQVVGR